MWDTQFTKIYLYRIKGASPFFLTKPSSESCRGAFEFNFLVLSTNLLVVEMIQTPILSDHNNTICTKQQWRKYQIKIPLSEQTREIQIARHQFNSKKVYKKQRMSTHVTWKWSTHVTSKLHLSLFFSVSTRLLGPPKLLEQWRSWAEGPLFLRMHPVVRTHPVWLMVCMQRIVLVGSSLWILNEIV